MASPGNFDRRGRQNKDTARAWTFSCAPAPRLDTGGERERIGSDETGGLSALHLAGARVLPLRVCQRKRRGRVQVTVVSFATD